jgi:hypothetical protein
VNPFTSYRIFQEGVSDSRFSDITGLEIFRHRVFGALFQIQVTVFLIAFQDSLALQKPGYPMGDPMHQLRQFLPIRCIGTMNFWIGIVFE